MRIFSSAENWRRVARRISLHNLLSRFLHRPGFLSHLRSFNGYDGPEILPSSTRPFCLISADAGQCHPTEVAVHLVALDTDTANPETYPHIWAGVIAVIFMCIFGFRNRPKTIRCGRARAYSAVAIVRGWLRTLEGYSEVWADDWSLVENYRFGTRTCDFLICRRCGDFIAAVAETTAGPRAVNVNCLNDRARFTSVPAVYDFEGETSETRSSRRAANWMSAIIRR
jgi:hypothetical protein